MRCAGLPSASRAAPLSRPGAPRRAPRRAMAAAQAAAPAAAEAERAGGALYALPTHELGKLDADERAALLQRPRIDFTSIFARVQPIVDDVADRCGAPAKGSCSSFHARGLGRAPRARRGRPPTPRPSSGGGDDGFAYNGAARGVAARCVAARRARWRGTLRHGCTQLNSTAHPLRRQSLTRRPAPPFRWARAPRFRSGGVACIALRCAHSARSASQRGDAAVADYTSKFDGVDLEAVCVPVADLPEPQL